MNAIEMLEKVQEIKGKCVEAIIGIGNPVEAEAKAKEFLMNNWVQILDILDDALYEHCNGKR